MCAARSLKDFFRSQNCLPTQEFPGLTLTNGMIPNVANTTLKPLLIKVCVQVKTRRIPHVAEDFRMQNKWQSTMSQLDFVSARASPYDIVWECP